LNVNPDGLLQPDISMNTKPHTSKFLLFHPEKDEISKEVVFPFGKYISRDNDQHINTIRKDTLLLLMQYIRKKLLKSSTVEIKKIQLDLVDRIIVNELKHLRSDNIYTNIGEFDDKTGSLIGMSYSKIDPKFKRFEIKGDDNKDIDGKSLRIKLEDKGSFKVHKSLQTKERRV